MCKDPHCNVVMAKNGNNLNAGQEGTVTLAQPCNRKPGRQEKNEVDLDMSVY